MKPKTTVGLTAIIRRSPFLLIPLVLLFSASVAFSQGSSLTYQGRLRDGIVPASAIYDLQFKLWEAVSRGTLPRHTTPVGMTGLSGLAASGPRAVLVERDLAAATLIVTKTSDTDDHVCDADCSLREAITAAASGDTILFSSLFDTPQTITLAGSELLIDKDLTITGPGADRLTLSGNDLSRVFHVQPLVVTSVSGMTVTGGYAANGDGGGIFNEGRLILESCHVTGNTAGSGGGIGSFEGSTTIRNSTISNNIAMNRGGGIWFDRIFGGILTVTNSTVSGNTVTWVFGEGGGIWVASDVELTVKIYDSTITDNFPGGVFALIPNRGVDLQSSIIAANQNNSVVPDLEGGSFSFAADNLIGNATGTDVRYYRNISGYYVVQADPKLGPLAYNGGPTPTHALLPCSLAIDHGINFVGSTDQRGAGFSRTVDFSPATPGDTDIGAFELQTLTPTICNTSPATIEAAHLTIQQGTSARFDIATVSDPDGLFGLSIHIASANPSNGVQLSDVAMLSPGIFSAGIAVSCVASNANFTLDVSEPYGEQIVTDTLAVTVTPETAPPVIVVRPDPIQLSPNDHKYRTVNAANFVISASDGCDSSVNVNSVVIEDVTSDEPENAPGDSDGNTINDIIIAPDCKSVQLRAERDGIRDGRVYTIKLRVRDASGNTTTASGKVIVPLSQNGNPAIESGPQYIVTSSCP